MSSLKGSIYQRSGGRCRWEGMHDITHPGVCRMLAIVNLRLPTTTNDFTIRLTILVCESRKHLDLLAVCVKMNV